MKTDSELLSCVPLVMIGATKTGYVVPTGGGEGNGYNGPFRFNGTAIENCLLFFGRTELRCDDVPCTAETFGKSYVYAVVDHGGGSPSLSVELSTDAKTSGNSLATTYRLLYAPGKNGTVDYRFAPVVFATE